MVISANIIRWGILGCGKIADKFALDLALSDTSKLVACASRDLEKSSKFATKHNIKFALSSYEDLVNHSEVDVIYIATPHTCHMEHTLLCLNHNKHVLCEKPLGVNESQVKIMFQSAEFNNLFLMEAMWTSCLPYYTALKDLLDNHIIGNIKHIQADFGFKADYEPSSRLFNAQLAGGSLLDIGIYPVFMALSLLGKPDTIKSLGILTKTGVDADCNVIFGYQNGSTASLYSTLTCHTDTKCEIYGTNGKLTIKGRFHEQDHFYHTNDEGIVQKLEFPKIGYGYTHEIEHVVNCLNNTQITSPILPKEMSILLISTMDEIRRQIGVKYEADDQV